MSVVRSTNEEEFLQETVFQPDSILKTIIDKLSLISLPSLLWKYDVDRSQKSLTFSVLKTSNGNAKTSKSIVLRESTENVLEIGVYINNTPVEIPNVPTNVSNLDDLNKLLMTIEAVNFCKYLLQNNGNRCLMFSLPLMDVCSHCFNWSDTIEDNPKSNLNENDNVPCLPSQTTGLNKINDIQCFLCNNNKFHFQEDLIKHYADHSLKLIDGYFECTVCCNLFKDINILEHYNQSHDSVKFIKCSACERRFTNVKQLQCHMMRDHPGYETYTCKHCSQNFISKLTLEKHACQKTNLQICGTCKKRYATRHLLRQHQKEHLKYTSMRCKGCKKQFDENFDADKISRHKLRCKKRQLRYPCMLCYDKFSCISQRLCHIKNVHPLYNC